MINYDKREELTSISQLQQSQWQNYHKKIQSKSLIIIEQVSEPLKLEDLELFEDARKWDHDPLNKQYLYYVT